LLKLKYIDRIIIFLMFWLLPVDMLNGFLLKNGVSLPISIGQLYKTGILFFIFFIFIFRWRLLLVSLFFLTALLLPTIYQIFKQNSASFLLLDLIKISKYLMPLFCFMYIVDYIKREKATAIKKLRKVVLFSYIVLVFNIFLKYVGLGYPMYEFGNIGSKGFFFAGNEISVLLIILSAVLAFNLWNQNKKKYYFVLWAVTLFAGLTVSSKTGVVGIMLLFLLIPLKRPSLRLDLKKMIFILFSLGVVVPLAIFGSWRFIQGTTFYIRLVYFSEKFDFWTFILSNRNVFLEDAWHNYVRQYDFVEKLIGVGNYNYELISNEKVVEMDIADIFFGYGFVGLVLFLAVLVFLCFQALRFSKNISRPYSNLVFFMVVFLFAISTLAGHVFSSGMAAAFVGILFGLMYYKESEPLKS
jgi:hypothetical protein